MTPRHHQKPIPYSDAYLNFMMTLSIATWIDTKEYIAWVRANCVELMLGFDKSEEPNLAVYGRMQFVRATGRGV